MAQQTQVATICTDIGTVRLMRDATLGTGAYGQVCKATLDGEPCAAKLLHPILVDPNNPRNLRNFEQECRLLREIRHPNIVQCLGVARDGETGFPVLLMELMDDSLTHFLEQSEEPLAYHVQVNISHDIALAVAFLHSKHIIHRDLSSNNVLLSGDGKRAKVTDFKMSKLDSHRTGLTKCPGTPAYMAPEALLEPPVYTEKLDCFQVGVLAIQIITRKFPDPGPAMNRVTDTRNPTGWTNAPVPEVQRRQNHLSLIPQTHPMLHVAVNCLKDKDGERPSAQEICEDLLSLKEVSQYGQSQNAPVPEVHRRQNHLSLIPQTHPMLHVAVNCLKDVDSECPSAQQICEDLSALKETLQYYDILLVGMTGFGKSTTGNKLLEIDHESLGAIRVWGEGKDAVRYFKIGDGVDTVTEKCKLLSNTHNIRVLDTPGFCSTKLTEKIGVFRANIQIFRWILQEQEKHNLTFRRVLYFLPFRGPLERAGGILEEEIKVMHEFLGQDIFNIMVLIATNQRRYQMLGFDEDDIVRTQRVFTAAFETVTGQHLQRCPPILYLPFSETNILKRIERAAVIEEGSLKKQVFDVLERREIDTAIHNNPGRRLRFRIGCSYCAEKILFETSPTGQKPTIVGHEDENGVPMTQSKCHPIFKYRNPVAVIVRGIIHITTHSTSAASGEAMKGKILRRSKACTVCGQSPGSSGCTDVGKEVEILGEGFIMVSHSTIIDEIVETDF